MLNATTDARIGTTGPSGAVNWAGPITSVGGRPRKHQRRGAHREVHDQARDGADRGELHERSGQRQRQRDSGREQNRVRRRPMARVHLRKPPRQIAVLGQRENRARAGQHLTHVVAGHRDRRADVTISAPAAPMTIAAPSASGVRVAPTSGQQAGRHHATSAS